MAQTQSAYKNILGTEARLVNQSPVEEEHSDMNFQLMPEIVMLKVKYNWKQFKRAVDSTKKRINEFVLFAMKNKKANRTNSFVRFLGESV